MSSTDLKTFAQDARRELRKQVGLRLDYVLGTDSTELRQRAPQVKALKEAIDREGRDGLIERVAYTWFNRLAALRFMDANGYHPFGARVITPASEQEILPELLQHARAGVLDPELRAQLDTPEIFDGVLSGAIPTSSREGTTYRMLLVAACHYYHRLMPFLFEQLGDATELLLPDDLLTEHSIVHGFRSGLTDEDCREVETLGWFYQYYISERKDEVMGRSGAVPKTDIPAVTQIFTPDWIVRYLVENTLGRLWVLNRPRSKLREKMSYYIDGETETDFLKITKPEEIRLLDPAGGSGHMLTYAFDLLYAIYEEEGYDAPEIPSLILRHNLYGVDICDRAVALASFALCMKARAKDSRFFRRVVQPHLLSLQEIRFEEDELHEYIRALDLGDLFNQPMLKLLHQFEEAKNFGSLIQPSLDERAITFARRAIAAKDLGSQLFLRETHLKILRVLDQAEVLTQRYHTVVANPPYMGGGQMNPTLKKFVGTSYPKAAGDSAACFALRNLELALSGGRIGMITFQTWMFVSSFGEFREHLLSVGTVSSFIHNGRGVWGPDFGSCAFCFVARPAADAQGVFVRLFEKNSMVQSNEQLASKLLNRDSSRTFVRKSSSFRRIPGVPMAYWISDAIAETFTTNPAILAFGVAKTGLSSGDKAAFCREWHEVSRHRIKFDARSHRDFTNESENPGIWAPLVTGGPFRKWYGNLEEVILWRDAGKEVREFEGSTIRNPSYYFRPGITWSDVTISTISFRFVPSGFIICDVGPMAFFEDEALVFKALAWGNTPYTEHISKALNPTVHFKTGDFHRIPAKFPVDFDRTIPDECVTIARTDWDNFETSWDFCDHPLLRPGRERSTLEASWRNWEIQCTTSIRRMQELETENNRLFIAAYGLDGELQPEVSEDQITLVRAEVRKDMAALVSYAVGCMFGRYSLNQPGLILADAGATVQDYLQQIPKPIFFPDNDGILPVLDGEWFSDDIVGRLSEFLRVTFGRETLSTNLAFIEKSLGKDVRKYFLRDFYKDHLKTYKKRPIYWMVSSPGGSFQALIYLHRYTRDTVNTLLNDYVREFIGKLDAQQKQLTAVSLNESARSADRTKAAKEIGRIDKMLKELRAWERDVVLPLAQQRIALDLDDGVKVNYLKFPSLLVQISGLEKKKDE